MSSLLFICSIKQILWSFIFSLLSRVIQHTKTTIVFSFKTYLFDSNQFNFDYLLKRCSEKLFVYTLRLLAGKFGPICTEFPLTTFSTKILKGSNLKFSAKVYMNNTSCNFFFRFQIISLLILDKFLWNITFCERNNLIFPLVSSSGFDFFLHEVVYTLPL